MADTLTPEQRRRCMQAIKDKDTKPEMIVRRLVHAMGYRYRLHVADLPGKPDLVFPSRRKVIFVHGCYWHRHNCTRGRSMPTTRRKFWAEKFEANRKRDRRFRKMLRRMGWDVLVVWECQTIKWNPEKLEDKLVNFLN